MPRLKNVFTSANFNKPKRNKFDLSRETKLSGKFGWLYPMYVQEVIPTDEFRVNSEVFVRMAPMIAPLMHRVNVYTHFFFVPNRIIWDEWEDFITGGSSNKWSSNPDDVEVTPVFPQININQTTAPMIAPGTLADYLGVPNLGAGGLDPTPENDMNVSALPFRAYQEIYNEYYRDENFIDHVDFDKGSGVDGSGGVTLIASMRERAWEKDYFTTSLPFSSKFGEATIPGGTNQFAFNRDGSIHGGTDKLAGDATTGALQFGLDTVNGAKIETNTSINQLREANALQRWLETAARNGTRYVEQLKAHFGVTPEDSRLQRPEYLGGGVQPIAISEVLQTTQGGLSPDEEENYGVGDMYGHGISSSGRHGFKREFQEHGFVIGILSIIPKASYMDGLQKHWRKFDKFDYYFPEFAHLGEQPVTTSEVRMNWTDATDLTQVFGYQQRYAEYKYAYSTTHGDFKGSLSYWHLSRDFSQAKPFLNQTFITCRPRTDIFAVDPSVAGDYFWIQVYHQVDALRPIPYFSIPSLD